MIEIKGPIVLRICLGTFMMSRPTLSCIHWWEFVHTECCRGEVTKTILVIRANCYRIILPHEIKITNILQYNVLIFLCSFPIQLTQRSVHKNKMDMSTRNPATAVLAVSCGLLQEADMAVLHVKRLTCDVNANIVKITKTRMNS